MKTTPEEYRGTAIDGAVKAIALEAAAVAIVIAGWLIVAHVVVPMFGWWGVAVAIAGWLVVLATLFVRRGRAR